MRGIQRAIEIDHCIAAWYGNVEERLAKPSISKETNDIDWGKHMPRIMAKYKDFCRRVFKRSCFRDSGSFQQRREGGHQGSYQL